MPMVSDKTYDGCLKTMYGLRRFGIKLGLSTIRKILSGLGNPQKAFRCIHIAGTNGKGSVASSLSSILYQSGYKTGLYTSPHLVRFNERIQINNWPISNKKVLGSYETIKRIHYGKREPTFFEFTTAMALYEFASQQVDWAVIETGMGGRLDATNIIKPELSIITNVSLEHREYLGNTITQIAEEKAGIIKKCIPVITAVRQQKAISVIKETAEDKASPLFQLGADFKIRRNAHGLFSYYGLETVWRNLQTALLGRHQVDNAALALAACELLNKKGAAISQDSIRKGLIKNHWPGRLEIVSSDPFILLDGAHNLAAARNLARYLSSKLAGRPLTLVIGILEDKPYEAMLTCLLPIADRVILTRPKINRALAPERLHDVATKFDLDTVIIPDVAGAVKHAVDTRVPHGATCIAGSLYVVGEAKEVFERDKNAGGILARKD
jgi:dihydrofolate synthase/folylpolyglutamate synthase